MSICPVVQNISSLVQSATPSKPARFTNWTCANRLTLATTVVAVIAFAVSWFGSLPIAAAAFAFLGIANLVSAYCVGADTAALERTADKLRKDNDELERIEKKTAKTVAALKTQIATLAAENQKLASNTAALDKSNHELGELQVKLQDDNQQFAAQNDTLQKQVSTYQAKEAEMNKVIDGLQGQVEQFVAGNVALGQSLGLFDQGMVKLDQHADELNSSIAMFASAQNKNLQTLAEQIQLLNTSSKPVLDKLQDDKAAFESDLQRMQAELAKLKDEATSIEKSTATIKDLQAKQKIAEDELQQTEIALQGAQGKFAEILAAREKEDARMKKILADIANGNATLDAAEKTLRQRITELRDVTEKLEKTRAEYTALQQQKS